MLSKLSRNRYYCSVKFLIILFLCIILFLHVNQYYRSGGAVFDEYADGKLDSYSSYSILLRSHTIWYNYLSKLKDSRSQQIYNLWMLSFRQNKAMKTLKINGLTKYDFFDSLYYPNTTLTKNSSLLKQIPGLKAECGKLFNVSSISDHSTIYLLVINDCIPGFNSTSFLNIYQYYDQMVSLIKVLGKSYSETIFVWSLPQFPDNMDAELVLLHHHIITNVLIKEQALVVMQPYNLPTKVHEKQYIDHLIRQLIHIYCEISPHDYSVYNKYAISDQYLSIILTTVYRYLVKVRNDAISSESLDSRCGKYIYTRKFDTFCMPRLKHVYPVLVTGLGGSGTHYITNKLRSVGFKFYHEDLGDDGAVSWFYSVNDWITNSTYPWGAIQQSSYFSPRFERVIHVIRSPMDHISSFTAHTNKSYEFVLHQMKHFYENTSVLAQFEEAHKSQSSCFRGDRCHLHFAALTWIYWNRHARRYADKVYKIENSELLLDDVCRYMSKKRRYQRQIPQSNVNGTCMRSAATQLKYKFSIRLQHQNNVKYVESVLGAICWLFNIRIQQSKTHKAHHQYSLQDISRIDTRLAALLQSEGAVYGYQVTDKN